MKLSRDALIAPKTKEITVDGGTVTIRALTAAEAIALRGKDLDGAAIFGVIAMSIVDPALSAEDVSALPVVTMNAIVNEVFAFNALGPGAIEAAQAELKKTVANG